MMDSKEDIELKPDIKSEPVEEEIPLPISVTVFPVKKEDPEECDEAEDPLAANVGLCVPPGAKEPPLVHLKQEEPQEIPVLLASAAPIAVEQTPQKKGNKEKYRKYRQALLDMADSEHMKKMDILNLEYEITRKKMRLADIKIRITEMERKTAYYNMMLAKHKSERFPFGHFVCHSDKGSNIDHRDSPENHMGSKANFKDFIVKNEDAMKRVGQHGCNA